MANKNDSLDTHIQQVISRAVREAVEAFRQDLLTTVIAAAGGVNKARECAQLSLAWRPCLRRPAPASITPHIVGV